MNNINFGITIFNGHTIVKINCRIATHLRDELKKEWPTVYFQEIPKNGLTRIEAVLPHDVAPDLMRSVKLSCLKTQGYALGDKIHNLEMAIAEINDL